MGASHTSSPIDLSVTHRYERTHQATFEHTNSDLQRLCHSLSSYYYIHSMYYSTYLPCTQAKPRLKKLWSLVHSILNQDDHQMIRSSSSVFITALHCSATGHITPCMPSFWELVILGWVVTCLLLKHYMWVCTYVIHSTYIFPLYLERNWSPIFTIFTMWGKIVCTIEQFFCP
jgi:hypothetical protein